MEQDAVPARPAVNRIPGVRDPATRAYRRPVREELAERLPAGFEPEARKRGLDEPKNTAVERREARLPDRKGGRRASQACRGARRTPGPRKPRVSRRFATPHIPGASRRGNERGCLRQREWRIVSSE